MSPEVIESNAVWKAAEALAGHFALRGWFDMANDRGDLRRRVRDAHFDPNEPTRDDCLEAFRDALKAYRAYIEAQP
jgi:hypothetical protein